MKDEIKGEKCGQTEFIEVEPMKEQREMSSIFGGRL